MLCIGLSILVLLFSTSKTSHADGTPIQLNALSERCDGSLNPETVPAYLGFPIAVKYKTALKSKLPPIASNITEDVKVKCTVTEINSKRVVTLEKFPKINEIYGYDDVMTIAYRIPQVDFYNTANVFRVECGFPHNSTTILPDNATSPCFFYNSHIKILNATADHCTVKGIKPDINYQLTQGNLQVIVATVASLPGTIKGESNVSFHWFRQKGNECTTDFDSNTVVNGDKIQFISGEFRNAGLYVCMAYFNDKKIILRKFDVCVTHRHTLNRNLSFTCNAEKAHLNGTGKITCTVKLSITRSALGYFYWYKVAESSGEIRKVCNDSSDPSRISCSEQSSLPRNSICYRSIPSGDPPVDLHTITLSIKQMKEDDFGQYRLQYMPHGEPFKIYQDVTITMDTTKREKWETTKLVSALVVILLIIALIVIGITIKSDILWWCKKYFGPPEQHRCSYTSYFVYHRRIRRDEDKSITNDEALIMSMLKLMQKFGKSVYNEEKDASLLQCDNSNILTVQEQCNTIVIFLSREFVMDDWSRYAIYTAIEAAVKDGKKIIFITTPNTKQSILEIDEEARNVLHVAMKRNTTIHWNGTLPLSGAFRRKFEYALPKYTKSKFCRLLSDSPDAPLIKQPISKASSTPEVSRSDRETENYDSDIV